MNKHHSFRYRKLWPLFVAIGLTISFSNCNKTIENNDTIVNTVWKYETNDLVIELRFDDAETCSISNGSKNAYSVNVRRYTYEQGYGIDMYFYEKTDDGKGATVFTGQFIKQNELTLFGIEENVATYEYATLKRIK